MACLLTILFCFYIIHPAHAQPAGRGVACYARIYERVNSNNNGLYQPCRFKQFSVYKNFETAFSANNGYTCYWDDESKAPWCYNPQKKLFATYDDIRSVQHKTRYAIDKKLYGVMFWELRQDKIKKRITRCDLCRKLKTVMLFIYLMKNSFQLLIFSSCFR